MERRIPVGFWGILCFLGLIQCQVEEKPVFEQAIPRIAPIVDSQAIQYVLFCEEGLLEIWTDEPKQPLQKLVSIDLKEEIDFPMGKYTLKELEKGLGLEYPNAFYQEKLGKEAKPQQILLEEWGNPHPRLAKWLATSKGKKVVVFPSDPGIGGKWRGCFACPHWMAELYGVLEVEMGKFR